MDFRFITEPPRVEDYKAYDEYQSATPAAWDTSNPILYAVQDGLTLHSQAEKFKLEDGPFSKFLIELDDTDTDGGNALIKNVQIWVKQDTLVLFQTSPAPVGVEIPYLKIGIQGTMNWQSRTKAIFMSLGLNDPERVNTEEEIESIELNILPPAYDTDAPQDACIADIFHGLNKAADCHPDPDTEEPDSNGIDMSNLESHWITRDDGEEHEDASADALGPGAGTVRQRSEDPEGTANGVNGDHHEGKIQRTE